MTTLELGTIVDVYDTSGLHGPMVKQGQAEIVGYARNNAYVVREAKHGTTWHRHSSMVRVVGQSMPANWKGKREW